MISLSIFQVLFVYLMKWKCGALVSSRCCSLLLWGQVFDRRVSSLSLFSFNCTLFSCRYRSLFLGSGSILNPLSLDDSFLLLLTISILIYKKAEILRFVLVFLRSVNLWFLLRNRQISIVTQFSFENSFLSFIFS